MAAPSNTLTGTTGNDILTGPGSVATLIQGLPGNDTITLTTNNDWAQGGEGNDKIGIGTASTISSFAGSVEAGSGNDSIAYTGAAILNGAYFGANAGNDTIFIDNGSVVNATIGAGQGNDSINLGAAVTYTTSEIQAGQGADTITFSAGNFVVSTLQSGDGHDRVFLGVAIDGNSFVGTGKGFDSISVTAAATDGTIAGGGLNDTITFAAASTASVAIFGDANGVTSEGTGTGGAADGNDLISLTAGDFTARLSVYGAGGNDTIKMAGGTAAGLINGGNGADSINAAADFTAAASIYGGNGLDTITIAGSTSALFVDGGDGTDSIILTTAGSGFLAGSVNGGDGNDTININNASVVATSFTALGTVNGGAGVDVIKFNQTGGSFDALAQSTTTAAFASGGDIGNVVYESGDSIFLGTGAGALTTVNFAGALPSVYVASGNSLTAVSTGLAVGSVAVYDSGDNMIIGIKNGGGDSAFVYINVVNGDDMIKTTAFGNVSYAASNFGFTLAQSGGSLTVTFS